MKIIETDQLNFRYGKQTIIKSLNLSVPKGSIYGFLGPNGAGKSTTIKLLLGLLKAQSGSIRLFGKSINENKLAILARTGNMIETPSLYLHLNAWDNLEYLNILFKKGKNRIEEVLELVNLQNAKHKKVKHFSMGMKQRLGIAMALFHDPELLILDEPVNGLDPAGIKEIRHLLFQLKDMGKTIFISSHLLSEIEKTCTHIGIIQRGDLIHEGPIEAFLSQANRTIKVKVDNPKLAINQANYQSLDVTAQGDTLTVKINSDEAFNEFMGNLVRSGVAIYDIERESADLESLFIGMTKSNTYV